MAEQTLTTEMKSALGLTSLTSNAMALIAPGAFLWLTFYIQSTTKNTGPAMWMGTIGALILCLLTASCYAEMAKLYPGTGSSYYFAEQAFLSREQAWRYARLSKFIVGWASHLYYWIYPGVMVGTTGIVVAYVAGTLWPTSMSASNPGMLFMMLVSVLFSFGVAAIAQRGISSSTTANAAINIVQITALLIFSFLAVAYRVHHAPGSVAYQFDATSGEAYTYQFKSHAVVTNGVSADVIDRDAAGVPLPNLDANGKAIPFRVSYPAYDSAGNFLSHPSAISVISPHHFSWVFVQATIAVLILVGFESVTTMGREAKNAKKDIPKAVLLSLLVQGVLFYFFEYFAANYFLNSGYSLQSATGSAAPIGDMMIVIGDALFGQGHGRYFMLAEAATVILALVGTTLSCMNTGARVTYAMGKDKELAGGDFGKLHARNLTPHRALWLMAIISAVIGCISVSVLFGDAGAPTDAAIAGLPHGIWSSLGYTTHDRMAALPNTLLTMTLASNFGTFLLYALSCGLCFVAYQRQPTHSFFRHTVVPLLGLLANLGCMAFYIIGPFSGYGTPHEPLLALAVAAAWGIYGALHFRSASRQHNKPVLLDTRNRAV